MSDESLWRVLRCVKEGRVPDFRARVQALPAEQLTDSKHGVSVLHWCARLAREEMVRTILTLRLLPVDSPTLRGETPLHYAADSGRLQIVNMLLQAGANAYLRDSRGYAANHHAASNGHMMVLDLLHTCGLSVDTVDNEGRTPLLLAVIYNQVCQKFCLRYLDSVGYMFRLLRRLVHLSGCFPKALASILVTDLGGQFFTGVH